MIIITTKISKQLTKESDLNFAKPNRVFLHSPRTGFSNMVLRFSCIPSTSHSESMYSLGTRMNLELWLCNVIKVLQIERYSRTVNPV